MSPPSRRRNEAQGAPPTDEDESASLATFEEATARLGAIVDELERGELPLERSLALFEEGVKLARAAQARIESAERRVEELLGVDPSGRPVTRELASGQGGAGSGGARGAT